MLFYILMPIYPFMQHKENKKQNGLQYFNQNTMLASELLSIVAFYYLFSGHHCFYSRQDLSAG